MDTKRKFILANALKRCWIGLFFLFFFLSKTATPLTSEAPAPVLPPLTPMETPDQENAVSYKNVKFLNYLDTVKLERTMGFMTEALGVKCMYCHLPEDFSSDKKPYFGRAREMLHLVQFAENRFLEKNSLTCFSCHAGTTRPPGLPEGIDQVPSLIREDKNHEDKSIHENVRRLAHLSQMDLIQVMNFFVESMGASNCSVCHNTDDFSLDEKQRKVEAREMVKLVQEINPRFFKSERVTCYTCHQGTFATTPLPGNWRRQ